MAVIIQVIQRKPDKAKILRYTFACVSGVNIDIFPISWLNIQIWPITRNKQIKLIIIDNSTGPEKKRKLAGNM
jgi:hypothetical protein